jgi:hypothetical protein
MRSFETRPGIYMQDGKQDDIGLMSVRQDLIIYSKIRLTGTVRYLYVVRTSMYR